MLVLVAALGLKRKVAASACQTLHHLLSCPELPSQVVNSATETLLSYQAVPRLCHLLQPELAALPAPGSDAEESKSSTLFVVTSAQQVCHIA